MFDILEEAVKLERKKILKQTAWLTKFKSGINNLPNLSHPWVEKKLKYQIKENVSSITKIAGVDGGVIAEAMSGFDIVLYRSVAAIFHGIGEKVEADYIPNFNPEPQLFFSPSLGSRQEFNSVITLLRLRSEYEVAIETINQQNPTIIFLDGKVTPLSSDFKLDNSMSPILTQVEIDVKSTYRELVRLSFENEVLLVGLIKDSRSRELVKSIIDVLPNWLSEKHLQSDQLKGWRAILSQLLDQSFASCLLKKGERTAWLSSRAPSWLPGRFQADTWSCLVRPIIEDNPIRIEILMNNEFDNFQKSIEMALASLSVLCNHGLPVAIPTILLEADERARLSSDHLEAVVDQISISLGVPKEHLRKRRSYTSSLNYL